MKSFGTQYGSYKIININNSSDYIDPLYSFVPSIAISSVIQINKFHKNWDSDLIVGSLKSQSLYRLKFDGEKIIFQEPIWIGKRIRNIIEHKNKLAILTDDSFLIFLDSIQTVNFTPQNKMYNLIIENYKNSWLPILKNTTIVSDPQDYSFSIFNQTYRSKKEIESKKLIQLRKYTISMGLNDELRQ